MGRFVLLFHCISVLTLFGIVVHSDTKQGVPVIPARKKRILPPAKKVSEYSRLCVKKDIVGFWKVKKWTPYFYIPAKDWNKPAFMKFQWYIFSEDGKIKSLSAQKDFTVEEVDKKLADSHTALYFSFEKQGIMKIRSTEKASVEELWRCAVVTKDVEEKSADISLKKGDLLLTLIDAHNKILYVRQLKKINDIKK